MKEIRFVTGVASLAIILILLGGCGGGGAVVVLIVGDILGPISLNESTSAEYSVSVQGDTGITYQWAVSPPTSGEFNNANLAAVQFTANTVSTDLQVEIKVVVSSDGSGPVVKTKTITLTNVDGLWTDVIVGSTQITEGETTQYSIQAGGDTGIAYEWSVVPIEAGIFDGASSSSTNFTAAPVDENIVVQLGVRVTAQNSPPVIRHIDLEILNIPSLIVGQIEGPGSLREQDFGYYSVNASGDSGITYQWLVVPPDIGEYSTSYFWYTKFTPGLVDKNEPAKLQVIVSSDNQDPVLREKDIQIIDGFWADEINGPADIFEGAHSTYSIKAGGDVDLVYSWSVEPPDAGVFDTPDSSSTGFTSSEIFTDTPIEISVVVNSSSNPPVIRYINVNLTDILPAGWVSTWGGSVSQGDWGRAVATDASGNIYVAGDFNGTVDFDPGPETVYKTASDRDLFLVKLTPSGALTWVKSWGGSGYDECIDMIIDDDSNFYFIGIDTDPFTSDRGAFITRLDATGQVMWTDLWGLDAETVPLAVDIDSSGNPYVTGYFFGQIDFHPGTQVFTLTSNGYSDAFVSSFDPSGGFNWVRRIGGDGNDKFTGVQTGTGGDIFLSGEFDDQIDFDPGAGTFISSPQGLQDVFLMRVNALGNLVWVKPWGGNGVDTCTSLVMSSSGSLYTLGSFTGTVDFDTGVGVDVRSANALWDAYLTKHSQSGAYQNCAAWGGNGEDTALGIGFSVSGDVYVTGTFTGTTDLDPSATVENFTSEGGEDVFLIKLSPSGINYLWGAAWGGSGNEIINRPWVYGGSNCLVTGSFFATVDFDPGVGQQNHTSNGFADVYLSNFPPDGVW